MTMIPKVREWLDTQGFTLEMRTASAFRAAGFQVRQSSLYIDTETGKARDIDVIAIDPDVLGAVNIRFIVECKSSNKPWVLLCSPYTLDGYNRILAYSALSEMARDALIDRVRVSAVSPQACGGFFDKFPGSRKDGLIGYSVRQALSNTDVAYAAAATVAKACDHFVRGDGVWSKSLSFGFPVIVIDGPLIRCSLAENGDVQFEEADQGEFLFFLGDLPHDFGACIRVVTIGGLAAFTLEAKQVANQIRSELKSEENKVVKSWQKK
jgi:hypothetical protein